ncbi:MAG TPA: tetratricopeptide repeat protein [Planctomycetota bacterium]|nr:tetratricopeptide repeat protein [Planctomycetota bacterium]
MKLWIWNGAALVTVLGLAMALPQLVAGEPRSRLAPYRYRITPESAADLGFLRDRIARSPEGIDLALLAGACLRKAKETGQATWIEEAEQAARRSLEILPVSNPGATLALARAAQMKHDFDGSIRLCDQVLRERSQESGAWSLKATALLGIGRLEEALGAIDTLVDRVPLSENLALRAVILASRGEEREAVHDFKKACTVEEPGDAEGSAWLRAMWARLALQRGRQDEADDLLQEALRIRPFHGVALGLLGDLERERGDLEAADRRYAAAYQSTSDPVFLLKRSRVRTGSSAGEFRNAALKALREAPGHRIQLARVLLDVGTPQSDAEALAIAEDQAKTRRNAETLEVLARARLASGRVPEARQAIREALRTGVLDASLHDLAAEIETRLGSASRAELHRAAAREIHP